MGKTYPSFKGDLPTLFQELTQTGLATLKHHIPDTDDPITIIQLNEDVLLPIPIHRNETKSMFEKGMYLSLLPQEDGTHEFSYFYEEVYHLWRTDMELSRKLYKKMHPLLQSDKQKPVGICKHIRPIKVLRDWMCSLTKSE